MNGTRVAGFPAVSQFQLIGGIRQDVGDCLAAVEPGGAVQGRKGALYIVTEPAGDPALGGEACGLAQATVAHAYYSDPSPSITTSLTAALNKANSALLQYNRTVLAASDPPDGLPRKIRVGLSAAVVRGNQLYLCQLKPALVFWMHQGAPAAFPRPAGWSPAEAAPNGDGEVVGNFYPAAALGSGPLVEADFAYRRLDTGDVLVLCSSNLASLLDEEALARDLTGRPADVVVEYLHHLAQEAGLPEAHALAVEIGAAAPARRTTQSFAMPAAPAPPGALTSPPPAESAPGGGRRLPGLGNPFGRRRAVGEPAVPETAPLPAGVAVPEAQVIQFRPAGVEPAAVSPTAGPMAVPAEAAPPTSPEDLDTALPAEATPGEGGTSTAPVGPGGWSRLVAGARQVGRKAAPVVGSAGKATLGAAGTVLGATLPENVRQRGATGALDADAYAPAEAAAGAPAEPDAGAPGAEAWEATGEDWAPAAAGSEPDAAPPDEEQNRIVDFDAPGRTAPAAARFPLLRWLLPIAVVALLGILLFTVQQILSGQQVARVDGLLAQAQQEESESHDGAVATQRDHLLKALEEVGQARDIDPRSARAATLADGVQQELDTLNGVTRLTGLNLLYDFSDRSPAPAANGVLTGAAALTATGSTSLTGTLAATDTPLPAAAPAPPPGDYFSQIVVHGDDAFLLDKGGGRLYRFTLSTSQYRALLSPGDAVDLVGSAGTQAHVGALQFATWRPTSEGGDLLALDDAHTAYIWNPSTGAWQGFALGGAAKLDRPRDLGAYDGNLYLLWATPGQINKWPAGAYDQAPVNWLTDAASTEIRNRNPVAMAVDGTIEVLLGDGRIVMLSAGAIQRTLALPVWPELVSPLAIFSTETTKSLYVVEASEKRIIRVDKTSGAVQGQLEAPATTAAFDGLRNIYVDEAAGKLYVLSGKRLYVATLPPAPAAAGTPAPALPAADATATP